DLLGAFPEARINVDPKHDASVEPLAAVLHRCRAVERVCIGAFSDRRLQRIRTLLGPTVCTSLGPRGIAKLVAAAATGQPTGRLPAPCAQVPVAARGVTIVDEKFVRAAHK